MSEVLHCRRGPLDGALEVSVDWGHAPFVVLVGTNFRHIFSIGGILPLGAYHLYAPLKDEWIYCGVKDLDYLKELSRCLNGAA